MAILPPTSPTTLIGGLAFGRNPSKEKKYMKQKSSDQQNSAY